MGGNPKRKLVCQWVRLNGNKKGKGTTAQGEPAGAGSRILVVVQGGSWICCTYLLTVSFSRSGSMNGIAKRPRAFASVLPGAVGNVTDGGFCRSPNFCVGCYSDNCHISLMIFDLCLPYRFQASIVRL